MGAGIIRQVHVKATSAGDSVYSLAQIPSPATPSPLPAPGKPTDFSITLDALGALSLKWKCANPKGSSGTMYQIWRRIGPDGEFTHVGGSGTKRFVDETLPAGSTRVTYQIQAVRSTAVGPLARFDVNFGVMGGAMVTPSFTPKNLPTKIAA